MQAIRLHHRGGPDQLLLEDAPIPTPRPGQVRLRVHAAALTPGELTWDETYRHRDGTPRLPTIPGHDVAGTVDALGPGVSDLSVGDAVYGLVDFPLDGSAAEYVVMPAADLAPAPRTLDPIHAAAVPLSALTAWQAVFDHGNLAAGQRVLIHGGAGGVGAFAVQLARLRGAHVTATASTRNLAAARDAGAHDVIDYSTTPFDQAARDLDLVFDTVGGDTLARSFAVLRRGGTLVSITAKPDDQRSRAAGVTAHFFIVRPSRPQLVEIATLLDAGELRVNVEHVYPLARAREAFERTTAGHLRGKVVLTIDAP